MRSRWVPVLGWVECALAFVFLLVSAVGLVYDNAEVRVFLWDALTFVVLLFMVRRPLPGFALLIAAAFGGLLVDPDGIGMSHYIAACGVVLAVRLGRMPLAVVGTATLGGALFYAMLRRAEDAPILAVVGAVLFYLLVWALGLGTRSVAAAEAARVEARHRKRQLEVATDLHDFVAGNLSALVMAAEALPNKDPAVVELVERARLANSSLRSITAVLRGEDGAAVSPAVRASAGPRPGHGIDRRPRRPDPGRPRHGAGAVRPAGRGGSGLGAHRRGGALQRRAARRPRPTRCLRRGARHGPAGPADLQPRRGADGAKPRLDGPARAAPARGGRGRARRVLPARRRVGVHREPPGGRRGRRKVIRVAICDDQVLALEGLASIVALDPELKVVFLAGTREEALAFRDPVDVWLLDVAMPGLSAAETCRRLREGAHGPRVLMITAFPDSRITDSMKAGASGYLYKDAPAAHLRHALKTAAEGLSVSSPEAIAALLDEPLMGWASPDAYEGIVIDDKDERIVQLVLEGHAVEAMAAQLGMSESGFKKRLGRLMQRAGVTTRPLLMARLYAARAARVD